jgi:hypothetical protein
VTAPLPSSRLSPIAGLALAVSTGAIAWSLVRTAAPASRPIALVPAG